MPYSKMPLASFAGPSYEVDAFSNDQRTINLILMPQELAGAKDSIQFSMVTVPGKSLKLTIPSSPIRGMYITGTGYLAVVAGDKLYSIDADYVATERATLSGLAGDVKVDMADNGNRLVIVSGDLGWVYDIPTLTLSSITGPGWLGSNYVTYQDSFFIFSNNRTLFFGEDPLNLDPLDYNLMEDVADPIVRIIADHGIIHIQKTRHSIAYYNTSNGDAVNLLQPIPQSLQESGCKAGRTFVKASGRLLWLGEDARGGSVVYNTEGSYQGVRISNVGVEKRLNTSKRLSEASAWSYTLDGQAYYVLRVPDLDTAFLYNIITKAWTEVSTWSNGAWHTPAEEFHCFFNDRHLLGSGSTGEVWEMTPDTFNNRWMRQTGFSGNNGLNLFFGQLQMICQTGSSGSYTTDVNPELQWSDDSGMTFSSPSIGSQGNMGNYMRRVIWRRLGRSRYRVWRFSAWSGPKQSLYSVIMDVEAGSI